MKKLFYKSMLFSVLFFLSSNCSLAKTIEVQALTTFSSLNPAKYLEVKTTESVDFENGIIWLKGTIVKGQILDVRQPTRGKRDASFKFFPIIYTFDDVTVTNNKETFVGKYSATGHIDKKKIAKSAATTAGGIILNVPFFSQGVSLAKGIIQNPENNRLKSGVIQVYKDSPVSYIEEGKDVLILPNDVFYLKFQNDDTEDYPTKSHLIEIDQPNNENTIRYDNPESESSSPKSFSTNDPEDVLREVEQALK